MFRAGVKDCACRPRRCWVSETYCHRQHYVLDGKSQLAIEYVYQIRERSPETWVFWVHASNAARFGQSYRDIADTAKIFGRRDPKANVFKLVHDWLYYDKRNWVLVLDNFDDAGFLCDADQGQPTQPDSNALRPPRDYLPQSQNGSILITSRSREAVLKHIEEKGVINIGSMGEEDALALFEKKLGKQGDDKYITELAAVLEYMPLAIVQAAAYISQRAPRYSVRQYLEEFQKSDRKRTNLLNHEGGELRRDVEARNSIIITWQISFDHIQQVMSPAADLLSLMSFFDRQGIPEVLLRDQSGQKDAQQCEKGHRRGEDTDEQFSVDELGDSIETLRNYSFISVGADKTIFEMHGLVQLATRKWLEANGQLEKWKQRYIKNLCTVFPTGEFENWDECQALFTHAKSAMTQRPEERSTGGAKVFKRVGFDYVQGCMVCAGEGEWR